MCNDCQFSLYTTWLPRGLFHDIIVKSREVCHHIDDLRKVFLRCRQYNLQMNPFKCVFAISFEKFLVFTVHQNELTSTLSKSRLFKIWSPPWPSNNWKVWLAKSLLCVDSFHPWLSSSSRFTTCSGRICQSNETRISNQPFRKTGMCSVHLWIWPHLLKVCLRLFIWILLTRTYTNKFNGALLTQVVEGFKHLVYWASHFEVLR